MGRTKKQLDEIKELVLEIKKDILKDNNEKDEILKALKEQIQNVDLKIEDAKIEMLPSGDDCLVIKYSTEAIVYFDSKNDPILNEKFYAINYLDLLKEQDTQKILKLLKKIKRKKVNE